MLYTFAILRNPLKAVAAAAPPFGHYFGGDLGKSLRLDAKRYARIMTLDLADPLLGFLRFPKMAELPLVMDFGAGSICYSVRKNGSIQIHDAAEGEHESLLDEPLASSRFRLEPISYEQYRADALARAVIDEDFLSAEDRECLRLLGESYTQVGGRHSRAYDYRPQCGNPGCDGYGSLGTQLLVTVAQEPTPETSLGFLPDDPAVEFGLCVHCHCIVGAIAID